MSREVKLPKVGKPREYRYYSGDTLITDTPVMVEHSAYSQLMQDARELIELLNEAQNKITELDRDADFWTSSEFREKCKPVLERFKQKYG